MCRSILVAGIVLNVIHGADGLDHDVRDEKTKDFDVIISPSFGGPQLLTTNLTGNSCLVVPNGFNDKGSPTSISFLGNCMGKLQWFC